MPVPKNVLVPLRHATWPLLVGFMAICLGPAPANAEPPRAACYAAFGQTACGFDCKAAFGELKCAQTPQGVCTASFGALTCWDPPRRQDASRPERHGRYPHRQRVDRSRGEATGYQGQAACQSAFGETACGYGCVAAFGEVKCAQTPGATCLAAFGTIACGFDCKAAFGRVACARTRHGVCSAGYGELTCYEP